MEPEPSGNLNLLEWVLTRLHRPTHKGLHTQALFHFRRPT